MTFPQLKLSQLDAPTLNAERNDAGMNFLPILAALKEKENYGLSTRIN